MSTVVGRSKLDHPSLGAAGGSALHAAIETIYTSIGNDLGSRYDTASAVANSTVTTIDHNFGVPFDDLKILLYTGTFPALTRVNDPVTAGWTIAATSGFEQTKIDVTTPGSGGPHTFAVMVAQGKDFDASATLSGNVNTSAQTFAGQKTFGSAPIFSALTASTVPYLDASKVLTSSAVTPTQLEYLSGASGTTGTINLVFNTSPTLITPTLGVASATSINKVFITAPATSATLTLADGSTLATSGANSLTFTTTGATNVTLPTSGTLVNSAVTTLSSLTTVGALNSGSITAGFGSIDVGADNITGATLTGSTSVVTPLIKAYDGNGIKFQEDGGTENGSMSDAGAWVLGRSGSSATQQQTINGPINNNIYSASNTNSFRSTNVFTSIATATATTILSRSGTTDSGTSTIITVRIHVMFGGNWGIYEWYATSLSTGPTLAVAGPTTISAGTIGSGTLAWSGNNLQYTSAALVNFWVADISITKRKDNDVITYA